MNTTEQTKRLDISIVIPVYNERENLVLLDEQITKHMRPLNKNYEVVLVDDGSKDGSAELIRTLKISNPRLRLIKFNHNHGQTAAFSAGFDKARGDTIITMDVPAFVKVAANPARPIGLNSIGMQRNNFDTESINLIKKAYRVVYRKGYSLEDAIKHLYELNAQSHSALETFIASLENSERGILR